MDEDTACSSMSTNFNLSLIFKHILLLADRPRVTLTSHEEKMTVLTDINWKLLDISKKLHNHEQMQQKIWQIIRGHEEFIETLCHVPLSQETRQDVDALQDKLRTLSYCSHDDTDEVFPFVNYMEDIIFLLWQIAICIADEETQRDAELDFGIGWRRLAYNSEECPYEDHTLEVMMNDEFATVQRLEGYENVDRGGADLDGSTDISFQSMRITSSDQSYNTDDLSTGSDGRSDGRTNVHLEMSSWSSEHDGGNPTQRTAEMASTDGAFGSDVDTGYASMTTNYENSGGVVGRSQSQTSAPPSREGALGSGIDDGYAYAVASAPTEGDSREGADPNVSSLSLSRRGSSRDISRAADNGYGSNMSGLNGILTMDNDVPTRLVVPDISQSMPRSQHSTNEPIRGSNMLIPQSMQRSRSSTSEQRRGSNMSIAPSVQRSGSDLADEISRCSNMSIAPSVQRSLSAVQRSVSVHDDESIRGSNVSMATSVQRSGYVEDDSNVYPQRSGSFLSNETFEGSNNSQALTIESSGSFNVDEASNGSKTSLLASTDSFHSQQAPVEGHGEDCDDCDDTSPHCSKQMTLRTLSVEDATLPTEDSSSRRLASRLQTSEQTCRQLCATLNMDSRDSSCNVSTKMLLFASVVAFLASVWFHVKCSGAMEIFDYYSLWEILQKHVEVTKVGEAFF